jgi:hypothetical protein
VEKILKYIVILFASYSFVASMEGEPSRANPSTSAHMGLEFNKPTGRGGTKKCAKCLSWTCVYKGPMEHE